jgi:hypothetical protein
MNTFENVMNPEPSTQLATINDRIAAMREKAAQPIQQWEPQVGDCLIGELVDKRIVQGPYGNQEQFIIRDEHGGLTSYWLNQYIEQQLRAQGAQYGSIIAVSYLGKGETSSGKKYHRYGVMVDA